MSSGVTRERIRVSASGSVDEIYARARSLALAISPAVIGFGMTSDEQEFVVTIDEAWVEPVSVPAELLGIPVTTQRRSLPHIPADPFA